MILAIDPGAKSFGYAYFDEGNGQLADAGYVETPIPLNDEARSAIYWDPITVMVIEKPQVYRGSKLRGDPNDLISVALMAGAVAGASPGEVKFYRPSEWKGQVPKEIHNKRTLEKISDLEKKLVAWPKRKTLHHNVIDAISLGLYQLKVMGVRV